MTLNKKKNIDLKLNLKQDRKDTWLNHLDLQDHFVNPVNRDIHTQTIERSWAVAKLDLMRLKRGTSPDLLPSHLARIWWESLDRARVRPFHRILDLIRQHYPQ